uniref:Selenoprotein N n=1 Tax=Salmo trutta TaxID=8032 RepID=A0A673YPJ5_SALTR
MSATAALIVFLQQEVALKALGTEGLFLFSSLDTDHDLYLSPEEFKLVAEKLTGSPPAFFCTLTHSNPKYSIPTNPTRMLTNRISPPADFEEEVTHDRNGETLTLEAKMQPLQLDTMTKSKDGFLGVTHSSLSGLRSWQSPAVSSMSFSASQFRAFLPPKNKGEVGDTWWVIQSELNIFTGYLPNNRYHPPAPRGKEVLIHSLLSMFHPRPFIKSRFAPQGTVACIRAASDFYLDIVFRIHAEFQLNDVPDFPFWFTPGQFTGNIVLSRDSSHVRQFTLYVPNDRTLNVDMEWLYGATENSNMEVDIGYLPQMELRAAGPSTPSFIQDEEGNIIDSRGGGSDPVQFVFEDIHWTSEISREEAARRLEVTFYPFKKVSYLPFSEAFQQAQEESETVHLSPVLALLNQSFVSSWSLVKELEDMQANEQNPVESQRARLHLEKYNFPVEMMVALPNGTIVHHINANYFLDQTSMKPEEEAATFSFSGGFEDPSTATYINFLKEGLEKAKEHLAQ